MAKTPTAAATYVDFTRGLQLDFGGFGVDPSGVTEAVNVDFLPDGGWRRRRVVTPFHSNDIAQSLASLGVLERDSVSHLLIDVPITGVQVVTNGPGVATTTIGLGPSAGPHTHLNFTQVNGRVYIADGENDTRWWDGSSTGSAGSTTWNPTISIPPVFLNQMMPVGRFGAVHAGHFWVAHTKEFGAYYRNRVRWSHPMTNNQGELDWRSEDYVDIDTGSDGDEITGLVTAGDQLYVFKKHSVYRITGFDTATFRIDPVDRMLGAESDQAIATIGARVVFWDQAEGLCVMQRAPIGSSDIVEVKTDLFAPLLLGLRRGKIVPSVPVYVGAFRQRIFVSVGWRENADDPLPTAPNRLLVFDGKVGCWTSYDLQVGPMLAYTPTTGTAALLAVSRLSDGPYRVLMLDQDGDLDQLNTATLKPVSTLVRTAWLHDNLPYARKHLFLVRMVLEGAGRLTVQTQRDWDEGAILGAAETVLPPKAGTPVTLSSGTEDGTGLLAAPLERLTPVAEPSPALIDASAAGPGLSPGAAEGTVDFRPPPDPMRAYQFLFRGPPDGADLTVRAFMVQYRVDPRTL